MSTHHQSHSDKLRRRNNHQQRRQDLPAHLPRAPPSHQYHHIRDQNRQLEYHAEVHEEAGTPPHAAERAVVAVAVLVLREGYTLAGDARASFVQAVGDVDGVVVGGRGVGDPVGNGDGRDGAGCSAQVDPEGDAVDYAAGHGGGGATGI